MNDDNVHFISSRAEKQATDVPEDVGGAVQTAMGHLRSVGKNRGEFILCHSADKIHFNMLTVANPAIKMATIKNLMGSLPDELAIAVLDELIETWDKRSEDG